MKINNLKNSVVNNAVDKVLSLYDSKTGQFKYSEKSSKLPCVSAKIVSLLKKLNIDSIDLENSYQFFLNTQLDDGGWRCATVKIGKSPETDASNPGTTLYVLDAFRYRDNSLIEKSQLDKGIEFLLRHWQTKKPLGPCQFGIGTTFLKTEYPFIRYNIFYYFYVLSFYAKALGDSRFREMSDIFLKKQTASGIRVENPHKKWKDILYKEKPECNLANSKYYEIKENLRSS